MNRRPIRSQIYPRTLMYVIHFLAWGYLNGQTIPLPNAHAHNDYEHERPLFDALKQGFTSIEVDIHLIDGKLYVAHDRPVKPSPKSTLKKLYLKPLKKHLKKNKGQVFPGYTGAFFLMVDFKTEGEATYQKLKEGLSILGPYLAGPDKNGPVRIFISGERPVETIMQDAGWPAGVDGRPNDLNQKFTAMEMPVVSDNYWKHLKWNGEGEPNREEFDALKKWIAVAHSRGMKVRLWASPEKEVVWAQLQEAGVDLLNADDLVRLKNYLLGKRSGTE